MTRHVLAGRDDAPPASPPVLDDEVVPVELGTNDASGLVACAFAKPIFSWRLEARRAGVLQVAYEIERAPDPGFTSARCSTGRVPSGVTFDGQWPGPPLASREVAWFRIRVWTDRGETSWGEPLRIEGALFERDDWLARPISPVANTHCPDPAPVPLLRRSFVIESAVDCARLYLTALGICECWINGAPVSSDRFEPGWTSYGSRILYAAYDVTAMLAKGENVIAAMVGDGWWRGNLTWMQRRAIYGDTTALMAQLEITEASGARHVIATDGDWRGATGAVGLADIYDGCAIDQRREHLGWRKPQFDDSDWSAVTVLPLPVGLEQRSSPPVRVLDRFEVAAVRKDPQCLAVDCGQNISGWLRLSGVAGGTGEITVRHAEVLEADGRLHTAALRSAKATDSYFIPEGPFELEPCFTYHGFRFAEIDCSEGVNFDRVEACVVASDLAEIGTFSCSDARLNRLFSNIRWSLRGNFLAIPTDCPQRDERLGWTGDIQVFAPTACMIADVRAFLESWLCDLAAEQAPDGQVPSTVPNVIGGHEFEYAGVGWADAAVLIPWSLYQAYGSKAVLEKQFGSMRKWVDWGLSRRDTRGTWTGDFHLGDWLDPNAPPDRPELAMTDKNFIASAYLARSSCVLACAARVLGKSDLTTRYAQEADRVAKATWARWRDVALQTQSGCALAIAFAIAPDHERTAVGIRLAELVEAAGGCIATGFLGTPLVLPALTATGQHGAAYRLLLNEAAPGWLYQVAQGATTMWERWDAILPDGNINRGAMAAEDAECMTSFNHYAYGAVGAWMFGTLAGISSDPAGPGYRVVRFAPRPGGGISHAQAAIQTPFGEARIAWKTGTRSASLEITVPPGAEGIVDPPENWSVVRARGAAADERLGSGTHRISFRVAD